MIMNVQILYPLCALMLHFLDEADVFACIQYLLSSKVGKCLNLL